jgi:hypothetical protein
MTVPLKPGDCMTRPKIINLMYFAFVALLAASIPVSRFSISVFQFCLAGTFILEGIRFEAYMAFYKNHSLPGIIIRFIPFHFFMLFDAIARQLMRISKNRLFLVFLIFSLVYLLGLLYTSNMNDALKVLRNKLPILLLPMFFAAINSFSKDQKNLVLLFFILSASISSFISLAIFLGGQYDDVRRISPFINHIHLSIFINYSIFILFWFIKSGIIRKSFRLPVYLWILWLMTFQVVILKSLTGVVVLFLGTWFILGFQNLFRIRMNQIVRFALIVFLPMFMVGVLVVFVLRFYDVEKIDPEKLEWYTEQGNRYHHDLKNGMLENGHYVNIYISDVELEEEWNKVSDYVFDSLDDKGQDLKYTLVRYLTSKGLRKDARGVQELDSTDIRRIEQGVANHIFSRKLSLYPRIYQVLWELDVYVKSGNPTGHSVTQRLESLKMGSQIVKQYPFFGIGTGDLVARYHQQYDESGSPLTKENRITGANQFLNFVVRFGFIGLIIILFSWLYPAIKQKGFKNPLFVMFFFIAVVAMFSEEILKFQTGITFFAFFYSFFIFMDARGNYRQDNTNLSS